MNANYLSDGGQDEDPPGYAQKSNNQPNRFQCDIHHETEFYHRPRQKSFHKEIIHEVQVEPNFSGAQTDDQTDAAKYLDIEAGINCHKPIPHCHSDPYIANCIREDVMKPGVILDTSYPILLTRTSKMHSRVASF